MGGGNAGGSPRRRHSEIKTQIVGFWGGEKKEFRRVKGKKQEAAVAVARVEGYPHSEGRGSRWVWEKVHAAPCKKGRGGGGHDTDFMSNKEFWYIRRGGGKKARKIQGQRRVCRAEPTRRGPVAQQKGKK